MEENKSIIVYILTENVKSKYLDKIKNYFKDSSLFTVNTVNFKSNNLLDSAFPNKVDLYNYQLKWILKDLEEKYNDNYVIIIRDNLTTNLSFFDLTNKITSIIKKVKDFDIFYLFKYQDYCDKYIEESKIEDVLSIYRSAHSQGFNGIVLDPFFRIKLNDMLSKISKDYKNITEFITENISKGNIKAKTSFPNLFEFNIDLIEKDEDYKYTSTCISSWDIKKKEKNNSTKKSNNSNYYLYIVGLIILAILLFIIIKKKR